MLPLKIFFYFILDFKQPHQKNLRNSRVLGIKSEMSQFDMNRKWPNEGHVGLSDYKKWTKYFAARDVDIQNQVPIVQRAYARVGLIGNPSDGFHGKTIALSIKNFWAEATIFESPRLNLIPHPLNDPTSFGNLADLHVISKKEGYMGGLRLVQATCKKFYEFCDVNGIALPRRNFTLRFVLLIL